MRGGGRVDGDVFRCARQQEARVASRAAVAAPCGRSGTHGAGGRRGRLVRRATRSASAPAELPHRLTVRLRLTFHIDD